MFGKHRQHSGGKYFATYPKQIKSAINDSQIRDWDPGLMWDPTFAFPGMEVLGSRYIQGGIQKWLGSRPGS